ncbi:MAG: hypothetical protein RLN89_03805 [Parvibaculum sp.]
MPQLELLLSEGFRQSSSDSIAARLGKVLDISGPHYYVRRAADPSQLPQLIQLLGDAAAWLPLQAAASVYLSTLAKHAADATWKGISTLFKSPEVKPLADTAEIIAGTASDIGGEVEIFVGLNIPDKHWGTAMQIKAGNPEDIARALALFVVNADKISKMMQEEIAAGRTPFARAGIEVCDNGGLIVRWRDQNFVTYERKVGK